MKADDDGDNGIVVGGVGGGERETDFGTFGWLTGLGKNWEWDQTCARSEFFFFLSFLALLRREREISEKN